MPQPRILQQFAGTFDGLVIDQNATRQNSERAFENAHIAIDNHVPNIGAVEQGFNSMTRTGSLVRISSRNSISYRSGFPMGRRPCDAAPFAPDKQEASSRDARA